MLKYYSVSLLRVIALYRMLWLTLPGLLVLSPRGWGQRVHGQNGKTKNASPVSAKVTVDRRSILIGEPIRMEIEVSAGGKNTVAWPPLDSMALPHFVILDKKMVDSTVGADSIRYRQSLTVTSYDSGTWSIPMLYFSPNGNTPHPQIVHSDSIPIYVDYSKADPKKDYHDIRDIIDVPNPFAKWIGWIVAGASLLSLFIVIWLVSRKKKLKAPQEAVIPETPRLPPFEEAMRQMDELSTQRAWENAAVKTYYTRLNDILRMYVLRRLGIATLAETNEALIGQLRRLLLKPEVFDQLSETLRMSDFVKFAKYVPGINDNEYHYRVMRGSLEALEQVALDREAEIMRIKAMTENKS